LPEGFAGFFPRSFAAADALVRRKAWADGVTPSPFRDQFRA
jgi:hypothetical protein